MLNGIAEKGLRHDDCVRVRVVPGATEDMVDLIVLFARQQPDMYVATNDLTTRSNKNLKLPQDRCLKIGTIANMSEVFNIIRREAPSTRIV